MLRFRKVMIALLVCCLLLGLGVMATAECAHNYVWKVTVESTCEDSGTSVLQCSLCNDIKETNYNAPQKKGHDWSAWAPVTNPSCTVAGSEQRKCNRQGCGKTETRDIPKIRHDMTGFLPVKNPTCENEGEEINKCRNTFCTYQETHSIPKLNHDWTEYMPATNPTCLEKGTATRKCKRPACSVTESKDIPALGHQFGDWYGDPAPTCEKAGTLKKKCSRPGCSVVEEKAAPELKHNFGSWMEKLKPTCSIAGSKSHTCTRTGCGKVEDVAIPALGKNQPNGHSFGSWGDRVDPTCTKEGSEKRTCSACNRVETHSIPKLPHKSNGIWVDKREASTKQMGLQVTHCSVCGAQADSRNVAPRGYRYEVPTHAYGPLAGEFPGGGASNMRLIYLDLTTNSDQRYALVTEDGWQVGHVRVTVAGGTVRVSLEKNVESNILRYRTWGMFPDVTTVRPISYDSSLPFDQAVKGPGNSCVIAVGMITNYYQGGANDQFSDAMLAPGSGVSYQELNQKMLEMSEQSGE